MPRRSTVHPADIPSQSSNGNRGRLRSSKIKQAILTFNIPSFSRIFRKTTVHPDIPVPIEIPIENPIEIPIENPIENPIEIPIIENPIEIPIIEIANMWIENPSIDPYNKKVVPLSIHPQSRYVFLYKKIMDALINDIRGAFPQGYVLTIDDCKYIKNNLPIIHSIIDIPGNEYIKYDHLFIKYFVKKTKKYEYDKSYCEDSEIKLYLNIYDAIKRKNPTIKRETENQSSNSQSSKSQSSNSQSSNSQSFKNDNYELIEDLLKNNMDLSKTDLFICKLVINMCIDVKYILYMYEPMITLENYKIALHNKKTFEYVASLYNAEYVTEIIYNELYDQKGFIHYNNMSKSITEQILSPHNSEDIIEIYSKIISWIKINTKTEEKNMYDNNNILNKLIAIYDIILSLYARFFNKRINPKILIENNSQSGSQGSRKSGRKSGSQGSRKSGSQGSRNSGSQGSRKSGSQGSRKSGSRKLNPYCEKDVVDPFSQDPIHELGDKDRKYVVSILSYNKNAKKVNYYCFDTIEIYNYILNCIQNIKKIKNPFLTDINFTDDELDEICNKIKFLTDKPTYNSHVDIKVAYYESIVNNIKLINVQLNILEEKFKKLDGELHSKKRLLENFKNVLIQLRLQKEIKNLNTKIENLKKEIEKLEIENFYFQFENHSLQLEIIRLTQEELEFDEKYKKKNKYNNYLKISFTYEYNVEENNNFEGIYNCFLTINLADIQLPIINIIRPDDEKSNKIFNKDIPYITNKDNSFLVNFPIFKEKNKNSAVLNGIVMLNDYYIAKIGKDDISFPYKRKIFDDNLKKIAHLPPFEFEMNEDAETVFARFQEYIKTTTDQEYIKTTTDI